MSDKQRFLRYEYIRREYLEWDLEEPENNDPELGICDPLAEEAFLCLREISRDLEYGEDEFMEIWKVEGYYGSVMEGEVITSRVNIKDPGIKQADQILKGGE